MNSTSDAETRQGTSVDPSAENAERGRPFGWDIHGGGRKITPGAMVAPNEYLDWPRTIDTGAQHVVAMFGATLLVLLLTGFPVSTTLLFSGIGTAVFLLITRNHLPSYLGSPFAFIAPLTATQAQGIGVQLDVVLCTGITFMFVGFVVEFTGKRVLSVIIPPVITGGIVTPIGPNLAPAATENFATQPSVVFATMASIVSATVVDRGVVSRLGVPIGVLIGWIFTAATGNLSPKAIETVGNAAWIGIPIFHASEFHVSAIPISLPVVVVLIAENVGHIKAVATMTGQNLDDIAGDALAADGLATTITSSAGSSGATTYAENIGVMVVTRVYSTAAYWVAAFMAIALAFIPRSGAFVLTIPTGMLGGATMMLYGLVGLFGVRAWMDEKVDFSSPINLTAAATALIAGIGSLTPDIGSLTLKGIAWGSVGIIIGYPVLNWLYNRIGESHSQASCPGQDLARVFSDGAP